MSRVTWSVWVGVAAVLWCGPVPGAVAAGGDNDVTGPPPAATVQLVCPEGATLEPGDLVIASARAGDEFVEDKLLHLPANVSPARGDILICFDLTGSMSQELNNVKVNSVNIMNAIRALIPDTSFGVISHMDYAGSHSGCGYSGTYGQAPDYPYVLGQPLTNDMGAVQAAINGLAPGNGRDNPEDYSRAFYEAATDPAIGWRPGATKIILTWNDDVPHDCQWQACIGGSGTTGPDPGRDGVDMNADDLEILPVLDLLAGLDIVLVPLHSGSYMSLWSCYADRTGGSAFPINPNGTVPGGVDIAAYIVGIIGEVIEEIDVLTLAACTPGYEAWLTGVVPPAYYDVVLDHAHDFDFTITLGVPDDAPAGLHEFDVCALGDGAEYASQHVSITVTECAIASLGEPVYSTGHVVIPLQLERLGGLTPVTGVDVVLSFDPAILDPANVTLTGTVLDGLGWARMWNSPTPGELRIGLAGTQAVPEDGPIAFLRFDVAPNAPCGGCTSFDLDVVLNEGDPCVEVLEPDDFCLPTGWMTGRVTYWGCGSLGNDFPPIADVVVVASDGSYADTTVTDGDGFFELPACPDSCYTVTPSREGGEREGISPLDAALVLRYFVGLEDLDECQIDPMEMPDGTFCPEETVYPQQVAADVSGNGVIQSYDASIILKHVVGEDMSAYLVGDWAFYCESRALCFEGDLVEGQDFVGLLYGDVSGGWHMPWRAPDMLGRIAAASVSGEDGGRVEVPVRVAEASAWYGLQFTVLSDPDLVTPVDVIPSDLADGALLEWNDVAGTLKVGIASVFGIGGEGEVCRIVYSIHGGMTAEGSCQLRLADAYANESSECLNTVDGMITWDSASGVDGLAIDVATTRLYPPRPNPFEGSTLVRFTLQSGGDVVVKVCDVSGRVVATLVDGFEGPGLHEVLWRGEGDDGRRVASGVYFCTMRCGDRAEQRKMICLD